MTELKCVDDVGSRFYACLLSGVDHCCDRDRDLYPYLDHSPYRIRTIALEKAMWTTVYNLSHVGKQWIRGSAAGLALSHAHAYARDSDFANESSSEHVDSQYV
jgi:hypothetical protein